VRSTDNADLASGYANVVVLSPLGGRSQTPLDPATRIPAARAGFAQGKQEAARVTFL
jgi:hypothetical protein